MSFEIYARAAREATRWVPDAVRMDIFGSKSVVNPGDEDVGEGGIWSASVRFGSLGRCQIAPVFGCFATPKGIWK